jgi:hypothetical protein
MDTRLEKTLNPLFSSIFRIERLNIFRDDQPNAIISDAYIILFCCFGSVSAKN